MNFTYVFIRNSNVQNIHLPVKQSYFYKFIKSRIHYDTELKPVEEPTQNPQPSSKSTRNSFERSGLPEQCHF